VEHAAQMHVLEAEAIFVKICNLPRQRQPRHDVEGLAVDVFDEQMDLADAEQPIARRFQA